MFQNDPERFRTMLQKNPQGTPRRLQNDPRALQYDIRMLQNDPQNALERPQNAQDNPMMTLERPQNDPGISCLHVFWLLLAAASCC